MARRWGRGDAVAWRSRPQQTIGYCSPQIMVVDTDDLVVLFQPTGTVCKRRSGPRGGPGGRQLIEWDGTHVDVVFDRPSNAKLHVPGTAHTVIRNWSGSAYTGWYVNLESDWTRTPMGFDSWDHVLDVTVADDLSSWAWKDEDELSWSVVEGKVSAEDARAIRAEGERVIERIEARAWPFSDHWAEWHPDPTWAVPELPDGWDR